MEFLLDSPAGIPLDGYETDAFTFALAGEELVGIPFEDIARLPLDGDETGAFTPTSLILNVKTESSSQHSPQAMGHFDFTIFD